MAASSNHSKSFANIDLVISRIICGLPGGTQSLLVSDESNNLYVLKSPLNPQGPNVLANEWLASQVVTSLGLSTRKLYKTWVPPDFRESGDPTFLGLLCEFIMPPEGKQCFEILPSEFSGRVINAPEFFGALVLDVWAGATDRRQALYLESASDTLTAFFIDHGHLFGGPAWSFDGAPGRARSIDTAVYGESPDFELIAAWISEIRTNVVQILPSLLESLPGEWYQGCLVQLEAKLIDRANRLDELMCKELFHIYGASQAARKANCLLPSYRRHGVKAFDPSCRIIPELGRNHK